jgi:sacsin
MLADRASFSDNGIYWPGNKKVVEIDEYNVISTVVMDSVYEMAVATDLPVIRSKFHSRALRPRDAHLMYLLPAAVSEVLNAIQPPDVIKLPASVARRLQKANGGNGIRLVGAKFVQEQIKSNPTCFSAKMFQPEVVQLLKVQDLINFLLKDSDPFNCLNGLHLIPLMNGDYEAFGPASGACFYFLPLNTPEDDDVFLPSRIVQRTMNVEKLSKIPQLNIKPIGNDNIGLLLSDHIAPSTILENADSTMQTWIKKFWKLFPSLKLSPSAISHYPLIPTLTPGTYNSLDHCKTPSSVIADFTRADFFLAPCLIQMGFTVINTATLSREIRPALSPSPLTVEEVLEKLFHHPRSLEDLFNSLNSEMRSKFNSWIRSACQGKRKKKYLLNSSNHPEYRSLPLWRSADHSYVSAAEADMLPQSIALSSVAPFASTTVVGFDPLLSKMGNRPISSIRPLLNIPLHLEGHLDEAFENLVRALLAHSSTSEGIPLPNTQRLIQESRNLYSSRDDLFLAAFGSDSEHFLLPSFRKFEDRLGPFGLIQKRNLTISIFRTCVQAFQNATGNDLRDRAAIIFIVYAEELPLHAKSKESEWKTLDHLKFIPRNVFPNPLPGVDATNYIDAEVQSLPDIVSPNKLVRAEFMSIAWSQRALYSVEPANRVLLTYPGLSVPTAKEVVSRLYLSSFQLTF